MVKGTGTTGAAKLEKTDIRSIEKSEKKEISISGYLLFHPIHIIENESYVSIILYLGCSTT